MNPTHTLDSSEYVSWLIKRALKRCLLIADSLSEVGKGLGVVEMHQAAVSVSGGDVLIDPAISPDELGEALVTEFAVTPRGTYVAERDELANGPPAVGTMGEDLIVDRLLNLYDIPPWAGFV